MYLIRYFHTFKYYIYDTKNVKQKTNSRIMPAVVKKFARSLWFCRYKNMSSV